MKEYSKDEFISLIESTLIPSLNSIELERNSISDYQNRFISRNDNLAEIYHENSKLNDYNKNFIIGNESLIKEVKDWYLKTTCKVKEEDIDRNKSEKFFKPISLFPDKLQELFNQILKEQKFVELLYSVDLLLLYEQNVYRIIPYSEYLMLEKTFSEDAIKHFISSILYLKENGTTETIAYLLLVGVPWRHMVFEGYRGYRSMLIEAGMLLNSVYEIGKKISMEINVYNNFIDNKINKLFNLDGIENYCLSIVSLLNG